jgi:GNAT superfamily N-acetyltransferase
VSDTNAEITIRSASRGDARGLVGLYRELADGRADAEPAEVVRAESLLDSIAQHSDRFLLVAQHSDGRLVGTVDLLVVPNLTHRGRPWAVVENVVVIGNRRRSGVGTALMHEAIERAVHAGCYKVQLQSAKHRSGAHAFYRALGFEAVSEGFKLYFE